MAKTIIFRVLKTLVIIISISSTAKAQKQDYSLFYKRIQTGDSLFKNDLIDSAMLVYKEALADYKIVHSRILERASYISKKAKNKELKKECDNRIKSLKIGTNKDIQEQIEALIKKDQEVRTGSNARLTRWYYENCIKNNCDSLSTKAIKGKKAYEYWQDVDSTNINILIDLFNQHGFLGESILGSKYYPYIFGLLLHFDSDSNNLILEPYLNEALNQGKLLPKHYAYIIDRHLWVNHENQKYWTWPLASKSKPQITEEDIKIALKNREDIYLFGTKLYLEQKGNFWIIRNQFPY